MNTANPSTQHSWRWSPGYQTAVCERCGATLDVAYDHGRLEMAYMNAYGEHALRHAGEMPACEGRRT